MAESPANIVVEGDEEALAAAAHEFRAAGWTVRAGWALPDRPWNVSALRIVCLGTVTSHADGAAALLAAARGARVVVATQAGGDVLASVFDDLSRLGAVEHRGPPGGRLPVLDPELQHLLDVLAEGKSLQEAARLLNYSRRTVDRRLAAAREHLGVPTTAEAIVLASEAAR